ncbi:MAG: 4-hydroxy-tetrahydrodipicolinate synthase [Deltaproteobacteria bacterium]|nr:4-hydroxy-tetrahydrodipicolinate synthase [Deltaproteobacteria bacterium]
MDIKGAMVAIITPFRNGEIDEEIYRKLVRRQIDNSIDVIVPAGTTGEAVTMDISEYRRLVEITVEECSKKNIGVLAGAGTNDTKKVVKLAENAKEAGADAILSVTPYYNKPTQQGLYEHYAYIAREVDIPIVLYNVPGRTSVNILPETVIRLSQIENIIGIKEASGSLRQVSQIIENTPSDFVVISGDDFLTFPMMALGAVGVISVTANVAPKPVSEQVDAILNGDFEKAKELHHYLHPLHEAMFIETNPIPVKTACHLMGLVEEEFKLPLCKMGNASKEKLKAVLQSYNLI